jgi:SAM-dependent methyltransferase
MDAIAEFKENAKKGWELFAPTELATATASPRLIRFARLHPGMRVLDVGCGTGVVALTAARLGVEAIGVDPTAKLLERARENAKLMGVAVDWREGDAEALPFEEGEFDAVVSQFGHMFAPRPELAVREMLRVLKPGGTIAFATWPPQFAVGRMFQLVGKHAPPAPPGVSPPHLWGDPSVVRERLGDAVTDLAFDSGLMRFQILSLQHMRVFLESNVGPIAAVVRALGARDSATLEEFRRDLEQTLSEYFEDNTLRQDYLLTRAKKR